MKKVLRKSFESNISSYLVSIILKKYIKYILVENILGCTFSI